MVSISLVGQMLATITYIEVKSIAFVDEYQRDIDVIKIGKGESIQLQVKVLPELAYNKAITYMSIDENVATVSKSGTLTGIKYGYTTIIAESVDGSKKDKITVNVTNESVESVNIDIDYKEIYLHQSFQLTWAVYPVSAIDKKVNWTSSNPEYVTVDANGLITAKKKTEDGQVITITATTRDGNKVDTCEIAVVARVLAFVPQTQGISMYSSKSTEIDLKTFVDYDDSVISYEDIEFAITQGKAYACLENDKLTLDPQYKGQPLQLMARVRNTTIEAYIMIRYVGE